MDAFGRALTGVAACSAAACVPLEQAPLVYSSKQQIGVGVTAGTPENPGLDVNIGYKGLDAAFVPVFASKSCVSTQQPSCLPLDPNLVRVMGNNKVTSQSLAEREQMNRLASDIAATETALKPLREQLGTTEAQLKRLDEETALAREADSLSAKPLIAPSGVPASTDGAIPPPVVLRTTAEDGRLTDIQAQLREIAEIRANKSTLEQQVATLKTSIDTLADQKLASQRSLERLERSRNETADDQKDDALSVYGSFNGNAGGTAKGATLTLGKVFSTGIAAQNLSQGIGAGARTSGTAECLVQAEKTYAAHDSGDAAEAKEFWRALMRGCGLRW